jgi:hypothetical protein
MPEIKLQIIRLCRKLFFAGGGSGALFERAAVTLDDSDFSTGKQP